MLQSADYEGAIESQDLRRTLYDMGWQALLGQMAIDAMEDRDNREELLALRRLLESLHQHMHGIAGGGTFDRFSRLEKLNEEAQS